MDAAMNAIAGQVSDALYELGYRINLAWRVAVAWRPHHLWCTAMAFRAATGTLVFSEGLVTVASCRCGLGRVYDTNGHLHAGDIVVAAK